MTDPDVPPTVSPAGPPAGGPAAPPAVPPTAPPPRHAVPAAAPAPHPARLSIIANPVPVGVGGFALTTFTLGMYTSGQFHAGGEVLVLALAVFYGGLVQLIAGFFALAKGELFPAAFMTSYGAFWLSYVALVEFVVPRAGAAAGQAVAIFLIMWTIITLIFTVATLGTNWFVFFTFIVFDIAIILADIGASGQTSGANATYADITKAAGYAEMVLAAMAWYIVMAEIVNDTLKRQVFPLFPFRRPLIGGARAAAG